MHIYRLQERPTEQYHLYLRFRNAFVLNSAYPEGERSVVTLEKQTQGNTDLMLVLLDSPALRIDPARQSIRRGGERKAQNNSFSFSFHVL